jgi:diguanylate cyclase (GGDEF)-like protein
VYVVLLSARGQQEDLLAGLQAGADDYLRKPFDRHELEARLLVGKRIVAMQAELVAAKHQLWLLASRDSLTNVWNRRGILEILERELARNERWPEEPLSVMLADVDHFKKINDTFGHPAGDRVLATVAGVLAEHCRVYDSVGRYGGEEFILVLPRTGPQEAAAVAERLRSAVERCQVPFRGNVEVRISIGVAATTPRRGQNLEDLLERADQALYRAKELGRNRVEIDSRSDIPEAGETRKDGQAA